MDIEKANTQGLPEQLAKLCYLCHKARAWLH
jgi:hypothetical protein